MYGGQDGLILISTPSTFLTINRRCGGAYTRTHRRWYVYLYSIMDRTKHAWLRPRPDLIAVISVVVHKLRPIICCRSRASEGYARTRAEGDPT